MLLLSDGSPVCGSCSYSCSVCKLPILDEAIVTGEYSPASMQIQISPFAGNESYHAACFTCRSCSKKIEVLVFAKTSHGVYCMACHNERVARSRRLVEAKMDEKTGG